MSQCLSGGNKSYSILSIPFQIYNHSNGALHETDATPPILTIVLSVVEMGEYGMTEHLNGIGKVDTMFSHVLPVLLLIPFELHTDSVYTCCRYVNSEVLKMPTTE